jgi:5-methylcytosine-specific restriction endonuclease McrA
MAEIDYISPRECIIKKCSCCGLLLSSDLFSPDKRASTGLQSACKACSGKRKKIAYRSNIEESRERSRQYYNDHKESISRSNEKSRKKCADAIKKRKKEYYLRVKDLPEFKARRAEYAKLNSKKKSDYDRQYRLKNKDHLDLIKSEWRKRNSFLVDMIQRNYKARRRAQEGEGDATRKIKEWAQSQKKICYWCGVGCSANFHIDHYVPLSRGGKHEISNLVIACKACNLKKNAKDPYDFAKLSGRLF